MTMRSHNILGSPPFVLLGVLLARLVPTRWSYWLAHQVARRLRRRRTRVFTILRDNLAHAVGLDATREALDDLAEKAVAHAGRTYVDMFRTTAEDYRSGRIPVRVQPGAWAALQEVARNGRGVVLVGPHISNFDLAMQWIAGQGIEILLLSLAAPDRGTRLVNWLRRQRGITVAPIAIASLRLAVSHLKQGGVVATGVDRPVSPNDEPLPFFDGLARLPTGHVRLALQTGARIVVGTCVLEPDGVYAIHFSPPMEMERTGDRAQDLRHNARRVLAIIEQEIRQSPEQWLMLVPVWPEVKRA